MQARTSAARATTLAQSPLTGWRRMRSDGYHGLSSRPLKPAPATVVAVEQQHRRAQRPSQMRHRGIHADHYVEIGNDGGSVGEVGGIRHRVVQLQPGRRVPCLRRRRALLQADEADALHCAERRERGEAGAAAAVERGEAGDPGPRLPCPDQPGPQRRFVRQPRRPARGQRRVGAEIRDRGGDGLQRGGEGARQAEERTVPVVSGQGDRSDQHVRNALERCEQAGQFRRHPGQHPRAARRQQFDVAAELQRVAETFLVPDQHRPSGQVDPCDVRQQPLRRQARAVAEREAGFVVGPRFRHPSRAQQRDGTVQADLRIARRTGHGAVAGGKGVVEPALDLQGHAEIGPGRAFRRIELGSALERGQSACDVAEIEQRHAEQVMGDAKTWHRRKHRTQHRGRRSGIALIQQEVGIGVAEFGIFGRQRATGPELGGHQRGRGRAQASKISTGMGVVRPRLGHALQQRCREMRLTLPGNRKAEQQQRGNVAGSLATHPATAASASANRPASSAARVRPNTAGRRDWVWAGRGWMCIHRVWMDAVKPR